MIHFPPNSPKVTYSIVKRYGLLTDGCELTQGQWGGIWALPPVLGPLQSSLSDLSAPGLQFWIILHSSITLVEKTDHLLYIPAPQGRRHWVSDGQPRTFWICSPPCSHQRAHWVFPVHVALTG